MSMAELYSSGHQDLYGERSGAGPPRPMLMRGLQSSGRLLSATASAQHLIMMRHHHPPVADALSLGAFAEQKAPTQHWGLLPAASTLKHLAAQDSTTPHSPSWMASLAAFKEAAAFKDWQMEGGAAQCHSIQAHHPALPTAPHPSTLPFLHHGTEGLDGSAPWQGAQPFLGSQRSLPLLKTNPVALSAGHLQNQQRGQLRVLTEPDCLGGADITHLPRAFPCVPSRPFWMGSATLQSTSPWPEYVVSMPVQWLSASEVTTDTGQHGACHMPTPRGAAVQPERHDDLLQQSEASSTPCSARGRTLLESYAGKSDTGYDVDQVGCQVASNAETASHILISTGLSRHATVRALKNLLGRDMLKAGVPSSEKDGDWAAVQGDVINCQDSCVRSQEAPPHPPSPTLPPHRKRLLRKPARGEMTLLRGSSGDKTLTTASAETSLSMEPPEVTSSQVLHECSPLSSKLQRHHRVMAVPEHEGSGRNGAHGYPKDISHKNRHIHSTCDGSAQKRLKGPHLASRNHRGNVPGEVTEEIPMNLLKASEERFQKSEALEGKIPSVKNASVGEDVDARSTGKAWPVLFGVSLVPSTDMYDGQK